MTLAIGSARRPFRGYPTAKSRYETDSSGRRWYWWDDCADCVGIRSGVAYVQRLLTVTSQPVYAWDPQTSALSMTMSTPGNIYLCRVWNIDTKAYETHPYPEGDLLALTDQPTVRVRLADKDAMPAAVAAISGGAP